MLFDNREEFYERLHRLSISRVFHMGECYGLRLSLVPHSDFALSLERDYLLSS